MRSKKKVLSIGGATQDIFLHYENPELLTLKTDLIQRTCLLFEQGSKIDVKKINYYTGGGATNVCVSFKRLGMDSSTIFKIGKDFQAKFILNDLKKEKIEIHAAYSYENPTAISFILPTPSDRIILAFRGANKDLNKNDISDTLINNSDLIYIAPLSGESSKLLFPITKFAKENKKKIAVNPGINQLKKSNANDFINSLKNIDILILNANEVETLMLTLLQMQTNIKMFSEKLYHKDVPDLMKSLINYGNKSFTILDYFNYILKNGPSIVIVTNGDKGVYIAHNNTVYFHESIKPEKIINTLGAGDAFASCFIASLLNELSLEDSLFYGLINASSAIEYEGAKTGLLTYEELNIKEKKLSNLKNLIKFNF